MDNLKDIHIGEIIRRKVLESDISLNVFHNVIGSSIENTEDIFNAKTLETEILLKISKALNFNFFRLYSQHLSLYSTCYQDKNDRKKKGTEKLLITKSIYSIEIIQFILELINTGIKTKQQVISDYNIPYTTLLKWIRKYNE